MEQEKTWKDTVQLLVTIISLALRGFAFVLCVCFLVDTAVVETLFYILVLVVDVIMEGVIWCSKKDNYFPWRSGILAVAVTGALISGIVLDNKCRSTCSDIRWAFVLHIITFLASFFLIILLLPHKMKCLRGNAAHGLLPITSG